jgi:chromosome partitioning protein
LIDVGPNLGAINRSALLAADKVLMPLAADLFSLRGLTNLGPKFRDWRDRWNIRQPDRRSGRSEDDAPHGLMEPLGYVVMQPRMRDGQPGRAHAKWMEDIPIVFATQVLNEDRPAKGDRPHQVGTIRDYGGLMAAAYRVNKPGFSLMARDGATADAIKSCDEDFDNLARAIIERLGK